MSQEITSMQPEFEFCAVTVQIEQEDPETGKIKKVKEEYLVDGRNVTEVEKKVKDWMDGTMYSWKIIKCQTSKVMAVYCIWIGCHL